MCRSQEYYRSFSQLWAECKLLIRNSYNDYCNKIENNLSSNPKSFWKYARSLRTDDIIPQSMTLGNTTYDNYANSANAFAGYFSNVYSLPTNQNLDHVDDIDPICDLSRVELTTEEILTALNKLKPD